MNGLSSAISGVGTAIGRYFSLVSFIPSLFLVGFTFALIQSGAWSGDGTPDWAKAGDAFTHIGNLAVLVLASIALGIVIHPIQVAMVQFLEGYWGTGRLAQRARAARMTHYLRRLNFLRESGPGARAGRKIQVADESKKPLDQRERIRLVSKRDESVRLLSGYPGGYPGEYPNSDDDIMPTRLGNVLRAYERLAGYQYALDGVGVLRHIVFVAPQQHVDYLNDQRQLLDLSVRMCLTSLFASLISIAFLWHHGPWLLLTLIPYAVAYISYRGAIVVAHEYGAAISTIIDLDRFALYDYLKLPRPDSTDSERKTNADLMDLLRHNWVVDLKYDYPDAPSSNDKEQTSTQPGG